MKTPPFRRGTSGQLGPKRYRSAAFAGFSFGARAAFSFAAFFVLASNWPLMEAFSGGGACRAAAIRAYNFSISCWYASKIAP